MQRGNLVKIRIMKKTLALLLLLNTTLLLTSQITYDKRIEFELKDGYDNEEIVEFGELGFIMVSREEQSAGGENKWKYEHYNTDLKLVDTKTVSLDKKLYSDETYTDNERTHTLYKDKNGNFSIVSVDASSLKITKVDGELPKKSSTKGITVLGDYAFLNATVKKAPFLFSVNWKTGQKNLIPISISDISPKKTTFKDLQILEDAKEIIVYAKAQIDKKNSEMYVVRLDDKGKKKDFFKLTKDIEQNIVDISASKLDNGKYIFTGTYSTKSTDLSEGLFFCQSEKGKVDFIKFYNFTKLENFLSYLPERKQNKLEKKKQRKEANDKELIINYRMATHEVIQLADGYLFLGEAFYPTYRTETYTTTTTSANGGD